ncbi:hypothetical protein [Baaleninema simplex]|uniref:hypothetical protein n=1 Tax=Baaleninema simplex TaxID=2862350 RepID=UPI000360F080|nr:hypothetical protein [Baaleninema simplex]
MSIEDLHAMQRFLEDLKKSNRSDIRGRRDWINRELSYRETQQEIRDSQRNYEALVRGNPSIDEADRSLIVDAIANQREVLWVESREQAERIFQTLDEMVNDGSVITSGT